MDFEIPNWIAMALGIVAAITVSANLSARITGLGFSVFAVSSLFWIYAGLTQGSLALLLQNLVLFGVNLFGVYRWLLRRGPSRGQTAAPMGRPVWPMSLFKDRKHNSR